MADRSTREPHIERAGRLSAQKAIALAKQQLLELTAKQCESVSGMTRTREGWTIRLDVVELERIPHSTDIMGSYQLELDSHGELISYERISRYYRNQGATEDSSGIC
jgi:gas vesicle protein GvpO